MSLRQWFHLTRVDHDADERDLEVRANVNVIGALTVDGDPIGGTLGYTPENVSNKDTDATLGADSDTKYPSQKAVKEHVASLASAIATALAGKENSLGYTPENAANKDTDPALAADSDTRFPSQKAVKAALANAVAVVSGNIPKISAMISGGVVIWESAYTFRVSAAQYFIQGNLY
jgi:hypothetical protein